MKDFTLLVYKLKICNTLAVFVEHNFIKKSVVCQPILHINLIDSLDKCTTSNFSISYLNDLPVCSFTATWGEILTQCLHSSLPALSDSPQNTLFEMHVTKNLVHQEGKQMWGADGYKRLETVAWAGWEMLAWNLRSLSQTSGRCSQVSYLKSRAGIKKEAFMKMQMQIFSLIFHDRDGYQPITSENKMLFQFFSPHKNRQRVGRRLEKNQVITGDEKRKKAVEEGKESKMLNKKWRNREKKAFWSCRVHRKEQPSKSQGFHLSLCSWLNLRTFLHSTSRDCLLASVCTKGVTLTWRSNQKTYHFFLCCEHCRMQKAES